MTTTVRDPWEDARLVATQDVLDPDVARVRLRVWFRRAAGLALGLAVLSAFLLWASGRIDPAAGELWRVTRRELRVGFAVTVGGFAVMMIGVVRGAGVRRPFVGPDAMLSRGDRLWLRRQVAENRSVPDERRTVVDDAARRMRAEGRAIPKYLGLVLVYAGMGVTTSSPTFLVSSSLLALVMVAWSVRAAVWSRRGERWLAQHA